MFRMIGKSLVTLTVATGTAGGAYYTYRSWDDQKRQQCQDAEERVIQRLPLSLTENGSRLAKILKKDENTKSD